MIYSFPDQVKAPSDVLTVMLDWSGILGALGDDATISAHTASACLADGGGVTAVDAGFDDDTNVQSVNISGGLCEGFTSVTATITLSDGTTLSRAFRALVR